MSKNHIKNVLSFAISFFDMIKKWWKLQQQDFQIPGNKSSHLFFLRKSEEPSEFKLFSLIEDTIVGLFGFIERMIRTFLLTLQPRKIWVYIDLPQKESPLVRPFTFLAIASFLVGAQFFESLPVYNSEDLQRTFLNLSIRDSLEVLIPSLLVSILVTFFLSLIFSAILNIETKRLLHICCYSVGLQQYLYLGILIYINSHGFFGSFIASVQSLFFSIILAILSYRPLFSKVHITKKWWIDRPVKGVISILIFFTIAFLQVSIHDRKDEIGWSLRAAETPSPIQARVTKLSSKSDYSVATLVLFNKLNNTIFIKKNDSVSSSFNFYIGKDSVNTSKMVSLSRNYIIEEWEDQGVDLLTLPKRNHKWIQIRVDLKDDDFRSMIDEYTTDLTASSIDLAIIDPEVKVPNPIEYSVKVNLDDHLLENHTIRDFVH